MGMELMSMMNTNRKHSISRIDKDVEQLKERLKKDYMDTVDKIQEEIDKILITKNLQPNKKNVKT